MIKFLPKFALLTVLCAAAVYCILLAWAWYTGFNPPETKVEPVRGRKPAPVIKPGQKIKVLCWNVQFMAGKNYHFFYEGGPDKRPFPADIELTTKGIAKIIEEEDPDIILLQEVDQGARRTDYRNQIEDLLDFLPGKWPCMTSSWYWKAGFVPHPAIMGSVGMKLITLSKYRIDRAARHQLALLPEGFLKRQLNLKRAALEARLPVEGGGEFAAVNTHLSAFAQGTRTLEKQVGQIKKIADSLSEKQIPWIAAGDFNLLPPGDSYARLSPPQRKFYRPDTEIKPLFESFQAVPGKQEVNGENPSQWYTHFPNHPAVDRPNKTIDYIFYSDNLDPGDRKVRRNGTLQLSDHLPVIAEFRLPETEGNP